MSTDGDQGQINLTSLIHDNNNNNNSLSNVTLLRSDDLRFNLTTTQTPGKQKLIADKNRFLGGTYKRFSLLAAKVTVFLLPRIKIAKYFLAKDRHFFDETSYIMSFHRKFSEEMLNFFQVFGLKLK